MKILGIEFAPLLVPLERRLQTAAVFYWTMMFLFQGFGFLFFFIYLLFTRFYFIPLIYLLWYAYDHKKSSQGGRRVEFLRRLCIFKYARDYFPISLIKTSELDPTKNYILGFHPHGVMSTGAFCTFATEAVDVSKVFPGIKMILLSLKGQFQFPLHREYFMTTGACDVSKESFDWLLTKEGVGNGLVLVVGGAGESLEAHEGQYTLKLKERKGFIKLALKYGASLVPVFSFGENDMFSQVPNPEGSTLRKIQNFLLQHLGFAPAAFHGRGVFNYSFGLLPYRGPINVVVGAAIDVTKVQNPNREEINELHSQYITALVKLFEDHKEQFGVGEMKHIKIV